MSQNKRSTILFTDDEAQIRDVLVPLLEHYDFNMIVAVNGEDALEKSSAYEGDIDLLLTDIEMPGMTGIELAAQLSLDRPEMKVLLMSGRDFGALVLDEAWQFIQKPFLATMLRDKINLTLVGRPINHFHYTHASM